MAEGKLIEYRVDNGVAVLEINRPPVNSYNTDLLKELDAAILDARFDDNVHAVVITGKVEKFFSAGADINMLSSKPLAFKNNFALHGHEVLMRLENTPKIVIAAINGHAVGGGLEIAMACDIRIAKKEGGRVGLAEINLGVMPGMGGAESAELIRQLRPGMKVLLKSGYADLPVTEPHVAEAGGHSGRSGQALGFRPGPGRGGGERRARGRGAGCGPRPPPPRLFYTHYRPHSPAEGRMRWSTDR